MPYGSPRDVSAANEARVAKAARRAVDDPVKLRRAARIVRAALERGRLTPEQVLPEQGPGVTDAA